MHITYSKAGGLPPPTTVLAVSDAGAGLSGSAVAGFNLLGLLKDFLSILAEKSIMAKSMFL